MYSFIGLFFFSSRRRHTRSLRDWSSDVCSSDLTILLWVYYVSNILTLPPEYGYVGVILITAFTYTLLRLRFMLVALTALAGLALYLPYAFTAQYFVPVSETLATLYIVSFGMLGCLSAYWMERFTRELFL